MTSASEETLDAIRLIDGDKSKLDWKLYLVATTLRTVLRNQRLIMRRLGVAGQSPDDDFELPGLGPAPEEK